VLVYGNIIATGTPDHPIPAGRKARIETVKIGYCAARRADCLGRKTSENLKRDFLVSVIGSGQEVIGNLLDVPRDEREPLRDWSLERFRIGTEYLMRD
jgi:hypothetical protein